jgi:hypothetical protein
VKRYIFILLIFPVFLCYGQAHTDNEEPYENNVEELYEYIVNEMRQYILVNNLPVIINNDDDSLYNIHILNDFDLNDKIKFIVHLENRVNIAYHKLNNFISTDATITEMIIIGNIKSKFYNECIKNNFEIPVIINNYDNDYKLLLDFLRVNNFFISYYYDNIIYFDIGKNISKLNDLMSFLYHAGNISKENVLNFYNHGFDNYDPFSYKRVIFNEYEMKTINIIDDRNNVKIEDLFSLYEEKDIVDYCHNYYLWLFTCLKLSGYECEEYYCTMIEINEGYLNYKRSLDEWYESFRNNKNK